MRKCRTCRKVKLDDRFIRDFPHCTECIIKYEPAWAKAHKMSLIDFLNMNSRSDDPESSTAEGRKKGKEK